MIAERIVDGAALALIKQWLKAPVMGEDQDGTTRCEGGGKANTRGTPQGGVISPLLSNCYLHLLDRIWQRHDLARRLQAKLVRYADDFVVLCRRDVDTPLQIVRDVLAKLDLTLNDSKTKLVDAKVGEFRFLGFDIGVKTGWRSGKRYPHMAPSQKAVKKIKARLAELTARNRTWQPMGDIVRTVNQTLRGWSGYFHYRNSYAAFSKVKRHAEERLRTHLRKRHKIKDRGMGLHRFPNRVLYAEFGLYKLPTTAGWKSAHALV